MLIIFILGFPKKDFSEIDGTFIQKIEHSTFCEIEKNIYIDKSLDLNVNCNPRYENMNIDHFYKNNIKHKPVNFLLILASYIVLFYMVFENRLDFF